MPVAGGRQLLATLLSSRLHVVHQTMTTPDHNPLLLDFPAVHGLPPFDQISDDHFLPAFDVAMQQNLAEIEAIAGDANHPTFENTIAALDRAGQTLDSVVNIFFNLAGADSNEPRREIERDIAPRLTQHEDQILHHRALFERIDSLWQRRSSLTLTGEQPRLLERTWQHFQRGGAALDEHAKTELRKLNQRLATLQVQFSQNLLQETNEFQLLIDDPAQVASLPTSVAAAAEDAARKTNKDSGEGQPKQWLFTLAHSSLFPFLTFSDQRELRKQIYTAWLDRGRQDNDRNNETIVAEIANLRLERANLLGYDTHADYVLELSMAGTPDAVNELLDRMWTPAIARANVELAALQQCADANGSAIEIKPWDWWYYTEKIRESKFSIDEETLKPYFTYPAVLQGAFDVAGKLFGLSFRKIDDAPRYHDDCESFEVTGSDGQFVGVLLCDPYTRPSKRGGAWMDVFREQHGIDSVRPIVTNVCNFSPPVGDAPSLLTFNEVETLFHEFGHALHGLLSQTQYRTLAGTNVVRDFVELPSQIMEHWASEPEVLNQYAKHWQTGASLPPEAIAEMQAASKFNQGFANTEFVAAAMLDMHWHVRKTPLTKDAASFEAEVLEKIGLIEAVEPRYRSAFFAHIFAGGYSAGYYSYLWSAVLDCDGFAAFKETGDIFDADTANRFRTNVLERGDSEDAMVLYQRFRGREPDIAALLDDRGLANKV